MHAASWRRELTGPVPHTPPSPANNAAQPAVSILACGGSLPLEIAHIVRDSGRHPNIVTFKGMADADYTGFDFTEIPFARVGALLKALRVADTQDLLIVGHARRPDLRKANIDLGFIRHFFTIARLMRGGDDHVLRRIAQFFEANGFIIKSVADVAPSLLAPPTVLAGTANGDIEAAGDEGIRLVHQLGRFDVGQAVIVEHDRVIAVEGAEGTTGLLQRLPPLPSPAPSCQAAPTVRILVKAAKPEQDLRLDLPTIGPDTITQCQSAGVKAIALEANRCLIAARADTIRAAGDAGIAILGLEADPTTTPPAHTKPPAQLAVHTRTSPKAEALGNAIKGLHVLEVLAGKACAAIVARENILALNIVETMPTFIERSERLHQWGDKRQRHTKNRVLVLNRAPTGDGELLTALSKSKIGGIALLGGYGSSSELDQLVVAANALNLFVLSVA